MSVCALFGNHDCPSEIIDRLYYVLDNLVINHSVDVFYIGNHGQFDSHALYVLNKLIEKHKHVHYYVVLAYIPVTATSNHYEYSHATVVPDGIENVPRKYSIVFRNHWILKRSDHVVTYCANKLGNTYKLSLLAHRAGKHCIELYDPISS